MTPAERRRFLSRLRPFWEVHRHRMARKVGERFYEMLDRGEVRVLAGRVESAHADGDGVALTIRERRTGNSTAARAAWVINCTGPSPSNRAESNPVIGSLLVSGWVRPDDLALGIDTAPAGNAVADDGQIVPDLFVVGTLRKPAYWESTAVSELRQQAASVAAAMLRLLTPQSPAAGAMCAARSAVGAG